MRNVEIVRGAGVHPRLAVGRIRHRLLENWVVPWRSDQADHADRQWVDGP
jgi:hypothetical protein